VSEGLPECINDVCITCSDMAVEVTVVRLLEDQMAVVDTGSGEETVSVALVSAGAGIQLRRRVSGTPLA
jgi:hydrogenase expression/formation protein HypC